MDELAARAPASVAHPAPTFHRLQQRQWASPSACLRTGKLRAVEVTGPEGAYVQGAPRQAYNDYADNY